MSLEKYQSNKKTGFVDNLMKPQKCVEEYYYSKRKYSREREDYIRTECDIAY